MVFVTMKRLRSEEPASSGAQLADSHQTDNDRDANDDEISFESRALAVAMGLDPKLGKNSILRNINDELLWKIMKDNFAHPLRISEKLTLKGDYVADLQKWIGTNIPADRVLYLASRDGWSGSEFHERCDGKGSTVSIVFCRTGHIFGGFASRPWSSSGLEHSDPRAFVFSLCAGTSDPPRSPVLCPQSGHAAEYAVYHGRYTFCPCFGYALALDLSRRDRCRSDFNQGAIYRRPLDPHGTWTDQTFLAGRCDGWDIEDVAVILIGEAKQPDPSLEELQASESTSPGILSSSESE